MYTASYTSKKKFQAATLPALVQTVQSAMTDTGTPDTFYVYAEAGIGDGFTTSELVGMFTWDVFGAKPEFRRVPGVTGPAVDAAQAELLDAARDAFHAAQDALEQVCLAEVYAEVDPGYGPARIHCRGKRLD